MSLINKEDFTQGKTKQAWAGRRVGITGASGSLGLALSKMLRQKGSYVIGLTHKAISENQNCKEGPNQWIKWDCGEEEKLKKVLKSLDVLVLNHGINPGANLDIDGLNKAIEVNALSNWRLIKYFEEITYLLKDTSHPKEVWVNTSEAEIQPAFSPSYEISKRLIGQLVSFKQSSLKNESKQKLKIKKLILGPFKSKLNPIGIMNPDSVAIKIINKSLSNSTLIIVTPNPITYLLMPLTEFSRGLYFQLFKNK